MMPDETYCCRIQAKRKGRGNSECTLIAAYTSAGDVVLRTLDAGGVPPIVAVMNARTARELANGLLESAEHAE